MKRGFESFPMLVDEGVNHGDLVDSSHKVLFFLSPGINSGVRIWSIPTGFFLMSLFICRNKTLGFCGAYCAVSFLASNPEKFATL